MNTQRILTKKAGFTPDMGLLRYLLDQKPTVFGCAVQDNTGATPELSIIRDGSPFGMKEVEAFLENAKDFPALFYFGEGKISSNSIQPIVLYDGDGNPFLAIAVEGDFSKHADPGSGETEEYNFVTKIICPKILDIAEAVDGDEAKIMAFLNGDRFNDLLLENIGHRGSLTILGKTGDPLWLGKNELGDEYDWGQSSNDHDYAGYLIQVKEASEKKAAAEAPPVEEKKSKFSFRAAAGAVASVVKPVASGQPPIIPKDVATAGEGPRASVPEVRTNGATTVVDVKKAKIPEAVRPPSWVHKNSDRDMWYSVVAGSVPEQSKKRPAVIPRSDLAKMPDDLPELLLMRAEQIKAKLPPMANIEPAKPIGPVKTETSAGAPKTGAEVAQQRELENTPIINAKDMEGILDVVAKIDTKATIQMSLDEIRKIETKLGKFSTNVGVTWQEMMNWPLSGLFAIGRKDYRALVLAFVEFRELVRQHIKVEDLTGGTVVTKTEKIGDTGTKTESIVVGHVAAKEELKPEKKSGFSFRSTKAA